ncbi:MAG TPA: hypothetical protein VHE61_00445 [Opitutaceae bacterium]|nr:hypothetical protein [Opitutaceae bacterium]
MFHRDRPIPRLSGRARRGRFRIVTAGLVLAISATIAGRAAGSNEDVQLIERVADWQLRNPCSFDIQWRAPGRSKPEQIRLGWDGRILRRRELPANPPGESVVPSAWIYLVQREAGNLVFDDLPAAAKATWRKDIGLDPRQIVSLRLMDEGGARGWEMATLYVGLLALEEVSAKPVYHEALRRMAEAQHWQLGPRIYHADDQLVGYLYLELY